MVGNRVIGHAGNLSCGASVWWGISHCGEEGHRSWWGISQRVAPVMVGISNGGISHGGE